MWYIRVKEYFKGDVPISRPERAIVCFMPRATIVVDVTHPEEIAACDEWFAKWTPRLTYRSENQGCGCCVNIWDVVAPDEALAALPANIKGH